MSKFSCNTWPQFLLQSCHISVGELLNIFPPSVYHDIIPSFHLPSGFSTSLDVYFSFFPGIHLSTVWTHCTCPRYAWESSTQAEGVQRGILRHLGLVLVREQVQRSTALSRLSPGKHVGTVGGCRIQHALVTPVTVMVISRPVFFPKVPHVPSSCHVQARLPVDSWFIMAALTREPNLFLCPLRTRFFLAKLTVPWLQIGWLTMSLGPHQFLTHLPHD